MGYVLIRKDGNGYYNGVYENGGFIYVDRAIDISPEFIFNSEDEIKKLDNFIRIRFWFNIVKNEKKLKPPCPYHTFEPPKPEIKTGKGGESCSYCGTNVLSDEPYLIWKDKKIYCLHCVMNQLKDIKELYGSIPAKLKKEWQASGKEQMKKCTEHI